MVCLSDRLQNRRVLFFLFHFSSEYPYPFSVVWGDRHFVPMKSASHSEDPQTPAERRIAIGEGQMSRKKRLPPPKPRVGCGRRCGEALGVGENGGAVKVESPSISTAKVCLPNVEGASHAVDLELPHFRCAILGRERAIVTDHRDRNPVHRVNLLPKLFDKGPISTGTPRS